jgi:hypothetical protein
MILGVGGFFFWVKFMVKGPDAVVSAELTDIRTGKIDAAYDLLTTSYKSQISRETFETMINSHPVIKANKDFTFNEKHIDNDSAHYAGTVTSDKGDKEQVTVDFQKEGGEWKISSLELW